MKILHISSARIDYPGGTEKVIWELAKRQAKQNAVTILQTNLYEEEKEYKEEEIRDNVKIITEQNNFFFGGFGYSKNFKKTFKKIWNNFDIVHIHGHGRFTSIYSMRFLAGKKPFIYSAQGFFHTKKHNFFKKIYDVIYSKRLKKASFCTALTIIEKEKLLKMNVKKDKIKIIPAGIDLKKFDLKVNKSYIKEKYVGKKNLQKPIMLQVSRIHESKGLQHVIECMKDLNLIFLVAGKDAGYLNSLKEKVKEKNIQEKVKFLGMVSDKTLIELYKISNFFVLYSDWEGFGIVIIEAMANGMPAIGSNNGALPLVIKNNKTGFIAKNEYELRKKIELLIKDKKLLDRMSKNAKEYAKEYDWDNISKIEIKMYKEAIDNYNGK